MVVGGGIYLMLWNSTYEITTLKQMNKILYPTAFYCLEVNIH